MLSVKRNQVIITALVVMIAVAGYLNYIDTSDKTSGEGSMALTEEGEITALVLDGASGQEIAVVNANNQTQDTASNPEGEIGISMTSDEDAAAVSGDGTDAGEAEAGTAVFVNSSDDSSYFVQAKLEREQTRSKQESTLTEIINNANVDKDQKAQSANALLEVRSRVQKETNTESLIEAKGFTDAYVSIGDNSVDIVVSKTELTDAEIAQIEDIVKRSTGCTVEQIYINPKQQ